MFAIIPKIKNTVCTNPEPEFSDLPDDVQDHVLDFLAPCGDFKFLNNHHYLHFVTFQDVLTQLHDNFKLDRLLLDTPFLELLPQFCIPVIIDWADSSQENYINEMTLVRINNLKAQGFLRRKEYQKLYPATKWSHRRYLRDAMQRSALISHKNKFRYVMEDLHQCVSENTQMANHHIKPQFFFTEQYIANWAPLQDMTWLDRQNYFKVINVTPFQLKTQIRKRLTKRIKRIKYLENYKSILRCYRYDRKKVVRIKKTKIRKEFTQELITQSDLLTQMDIQPIANSDIINLFRVISNSCNTLGVSLNIKFPLKRLENFALSLAVLVQCKTYVQFVPAVLSCMAHLTEQTLSGIILEKFNTLANQLWSAMDEPLETQGYMRDIITNWERMSDSKVLEKLREFMSFCMTFGTLEHFGLSQGTADIIYGEFKAQKKHKSVTSFALAFCDVMEFVFSRLCVCVESRSLGPLLHNADSYMLWYDDCAELINWNLMLSQDSLIRSFSDQEFQTKCEDCIEKGEEYIKFAKSVKDRRELNGLVGRIRVIYGDFMTAEIVGRPRRAPFCLLLCGNSSIGKTSIQRVLVSVFAKLANLPNDPRYFYTRNSADDFMSGFKSYMWFINMDDVATTAPKLLTGVDKSVSELFLYVQNIAVTANMADLNEKGKIAIRPELIIASTNVPTLNAEAMFSCPSAARRRLPWRITPTVKPEYRLNGDDILDSTKCPPNPDEFPDYWTYKIEEIRPKPLRNKEGGLNLDAQEILIHDNADLKTLLTWFVDAAKKHRERQSAMQESMKHMGEIEMCDEHTLPKYMCCGNLTPQMDMEDTTPTPENCNTLIPQMDYRQTIFTSVVSSFSTGLLMYWVSFMFLKAMILSSWWVRFFRSIYNFRPQQLLTAAPLADYEWQNINRERIGSIGQRVADFLCQRKTVVAATVVLAGLTIWKATNNSKEEPNEEPIELGEQIKFVKPKPINEKAKVRWVTEIPVFDRCNLLPQSISTKGRPEEEVHAQISRNVANVVFSANGKEWACNALFLGGFDVAINTHDFQMLPDVSTANFKFYDKYTHIGKNTSILFNKSGFNAVQYYDVTIIQLEEFPPFPSIKELFPKEPLKGRFNGNYLYRTKEGLITTIPVKNLETNFRRNPDSSGTVVDFHVAEGHVEENTFAGLCGAPLVALTAAGYVILGIHSLGGKRNIACASLITQDLLSKTKKFDVGQCDMGELSPQMEVNNNKYLTPPVELTPTLRQHDPLAFRLEGTGEVYGSLSTGPSNPKSKVKNTFVRDFWESEGKSTTCIAPRFGTRCWHKGLDDMMSPDILVSTSECNFIAKCLARDFIKSMTYEQKDMIEFYDYETAILGADGVNGVDKLDMKTSTGFPHKKSKKSIFKQLPTGKYSIPQEVLVACDKIHRNVENGIRNQVIFSAALKDEPREEEKVRSWSIRIFMSAPMPYCIVMRQYFLSLSRVIQSSPLQFETAVGINAHSKQWDVLANTLMNHSPLFVVGDHSKYDKRMAAVYIYNMFKVAIYIITHCLVATGKITHEEVPPLEDKLLLLAIDTAYAFVDFNGTLVSFLKNHVSGHILTVVINSFGNSGYIRMAYRRVIHDDPDLTKFQSRCKVVTYGDDFIVSVKPEFKEFNFISMKEAMSEFGVTITPAIKTDDDYEFLSIHEIDFLKRKFTYHSDLQRWVGPLDKKSIEKSLLIAVQSDSITPEEQSVFAMMSAQQEMFFYGRDEFDTFTNQIHECIRFYGLHYLVKKGTFPNYDELLCKYQSSSIVHVDDFVEDSDDPILFEIVYPDLGAPLDLQCDCQQTMRLNSARVHYDRSFEDELERDYKLVFQNNLTAKFRKLVMRCKCVTPYGFYCDSFCGLCQLEPQRQYVDSSSKDCHSFPDQIRSGNNNSNMLTRVEQPMSSTNKIVEGGRQPCDGSYLQQDTKFSEVFDCQMSSTTLEFVDETQGNSLNLSERPDPTRTNDDLNTAGFQSFLKRPVKIFSTIWDEGTSINTTFNPWILWAQQPQIKAKLDNFGLFRGTLHLKVMINASPFFYGAARLSYEPLIGYMRRDTVGYGVADDGFKIQRSQQKGFEIYPSNNQGGEMTLPFFYPKTWLDLTSASDFTKMGRCNLFSYTPLSNANSVVTAAVTITVIAWCEDAELSAPTYALAVQTGYSSGPISGPASAIAEAAKSLAKVPILRPYAMGTEMVASSLGSVAKYFGFTNTPTLAAQSTFKPGSHYGMASTEISTPYEKLGLDDKNELTIDPRVAGLPPKDEMVISEIIQRESFLTYITWAAADASGTKLFNSYVTPSLYDYGTYSSISAYSYYQTPMAHISRLFNSWRGSIIFRFRLVCTPFHKGRIRLTWDPRYNLSTISSGSVGDTITTSFTKIIDIGETQDVEMEIPYMQALAFMTNYGTAASSPQRLYASGTLPTVSSWNSYFNGTLSITVLNAQTSPVTSSDIQILVFVRAGEDFVFANPREAPANFTFLSPQMEESVMDDEKHYLEFVSNTQVGDLMKIHMGESIHSLRQLIHRQNFYNSFTGKAGADAVSAGCYNRWIIPRYPQINGYQSQGRNQFAYANGIIQTTTTVPVSYSAPSVFNMIAPLYIGARGAITYNLNVDAPQPSNLVSLSRSIVVDWGDKASTTKQGWLNPAAWDIYNPSGLGGQTKYRSQTYTNGASGRVITNQNTQAGIMAHFPYYSPLRFTSSVGYQSSDDGTILPIPVEEQNQGVEVLISTKNNQTNTTGNETATIVDVYMMAGHDFTFLYFNCVPTFYYYQTNYSSTS